LYENPTNFPPKYCEIAKQSATRQTRILPRVKRNFWLHTMYPCAEWYSTHQIRWENWWL